MPLVERDSYIKEEQTTQCPKEKVQKDKQQSTTNTYKTKDRVARTLLKSGGTQVLWKGMQFPRMYKDIKGVIRSRKS
jgi:hypothetical protein